MTVGSRTRWRRVDPRGALSRFTDQDRMLGVTALLAGVAMAIANGRLAPILPPLQAEFHLSLTMAGFIISAGSLAPGLLGAVVGGIAHRYQARRSLALGCLIVAVSTALSGLTADAAVLLALRLCQGVGDVFIGVAAPTLIAQVGRARHRAVLLALWATCLPIGLALTFGMGGLVAGTGSWRLWLWLPAVPPALLAAVLYAAKATARPDRTGTVADSSGPSRGRQLGGAVVLGAGFMAIVAVNVSVLALLPTFLVERHGVSLSRAGSLASVVALVSIPGSIACAWLMKRGVGLRSLAVIGLVVPISGWLLFTVGLPANVYLAAALMFLDGLIASAIFASVPSLVPDVARLSIAYGVVSQLGTLGAIIGVPVASALVTHGGWGAMRPAILVSSVAGVAFMVLASRMRRT